MQCGNLETPRSPEISNPIPPQTTHVPAILTRSISVLVSPGNIPVPIPDLDSYISTLPPCKTTSVKIKTPEFQNTSVKIKTPQAQSTSILNFPQPQGQGSSDPISVKKTDDDTPNWEVPESEWITVNIKYKDPFGFQYQTYKCSCCQNILGYHRKIPGGLSPPAEFPTHRCSICGKSYFTLTQLNCHAERHNEKRYKCPHCQKMFHTKAELRSHILIHTGGKKPFNCSFCKKTYSYAASFFAHLQKQHETSAGGCAQCK